MDRRTKIVATIGLASQDDGVIRHLLRSGVNVARLNMSHGSHEDHSLVYKRLRNAAEEMHLPICILLDLQGPKIRIAKLPDNDLFLVQGQKVTLTTQTSSISAGEIPVDFTELPRSVHPGGRILLDDGNLELMVKAIEAERVTAQVIVGGLLKSHKGISLPEAHLDISALTEKDTLDLEFGLKLGIDAVALSFVRSVKDIQLLREKITSIAPELVNIPIIAKLERPEALDHLEEILEMAR